MSYQASPPPYHESSIRDRYRNINNTDKTAKIKAELKEDFRKYGKYQMREIEHKNIMLIGRTRAGKSTIKALLIDPTKVSDELTLKSGTRDPQFQAFYLKQDDVVLNIIDTPGLFEHSNKEIDIRDNDTILRTIGICMSMEITKFHAICFCVSLSTGISHEDINSLIMLIKYLGEGISQNSCLIITRAESIGEQQRDRLRHELVEDVYFKQIAPFFKLGIFFSGSINRDDYNIGSDNVFHQYTSVCEYRENLIELFLSIKSPMPIARMAESSSQFAAVYRAKHPEERTRSSRRSHTVNQDNNYEQGRRNLRASNVANQKRYEDDYN